MSENQYIDYARTHDEKAATERLRRARRVLYAYFFVTGTVIAVWATRVPAVKDQAGVSAGELSIALLALASGALMAMRLSGGLLDRFGGRVVVPPAALAASLALSVPAHVSGMLQLTAALFLLGSTHALLNVSVNVQATQLQRAYGRPIIASFHAACSFGGCFGAIAGTIFARAGMDATTTFHVVSIALAAIAITLRKELSDNAPVPPPLQRAAPTGRRTWRISAPPSRIALLGGIALCCMLAEGAATDWSALYTREVVGGTEAMASATFAVYTGLMTVGRLVGDRLTLAIGPVAVTRCCGLLASAGLFLALVSPVQGVVMLGFGLLGAGLSCVMPQVFTAASAYDPAKSGRNLCTVSLIGYCGPLVGPVSIGLLAEYVGLTAALTLPAALLLLIAVGAGALRPATGAQTAPERSVSVASGEPSPMDIAVLEPEVSAAGAAKDRGAPRPREEVHSSNTIIS
ncbi:MFS transporter [Nocardiopsis ansamitocini]|uniref:MFS transporter n=1 Tax=Nocardiopsis ansamitocini TaxID=1670832 RepID=A0A9W6P794_9ACTN|nr:MFS transporter [Nocardiopsis ansamitocini]GLU48779.1 MFS transporter [Nocardiopsis ansamitocini]